MGNDDRCILITGVQGFIASHLAEFLLGKGYPVIGIDNGLTGDRKHIASFEDHPDFVSVEGDVNNRQDLQPLIEKYRPEFIFHYAACVGVKRTLDHPLWVLRDIKGIENIVELARQVGTRRVFFSSSSEVYGEPVEFPQNENTTPLNSRLAYAVVKNIGEVYLKAYSQEYGQEYTIFRFFNTYGPRQSEDFVMSRFIRAALDGSDLTIYGDGSQTRTFCYIDDNVEATYAAMESDAAANSVINIGSAIETPILELAKEVLQVSGADSRIVHLPPLPDGDMTRRLPDNTSMLNLLGGRSLVTLEEGIERTLEYFSATYD